MKNQERKLTSVRIDKPLYEDFQEHCIREKFSLQKLVTRAIYLYINDKEFREKIRTKTNINL